MMNSSLRLSALLAAAMLLGACTDHGNKPLLLPVGSPAQFPQVVHILCVGDADAAYDRAKDEFAKRAQMYGPGVVPEQLAEQESQANAAARMKYISCASSQGYRAVYQ